MRITILAYGSRGDIQPYLALSLGLARAGYQVRLAAPSLFREMVERYAQYPGPAVEFAGLSGDPTQLMRAASSTAPTLRLLPSPVRMGLTVASHVAPLVTALIHDVRAACQDTDLVIHTLLTALLGHQIAQEMGIPDISALIFPVFIPTTAFPNPLFRPWPGWSRRFGPRATHFGPRYNYLTHREFNRIYWLGSRLTINAIRRRNPEVIGPLSAWPFGKLEYGLFTSSPADTPQNPTPILFGLSSHALPCPADWALTDESAPPGCSCLTGYWFLDAPPGWHPPQALLDFLDAGPPPVFVGFGSLIPRDARWLAQIALDALAQNGQRGIMLGGWGGLAVEGLPSSVYALNEAPFDWLFPRMAAAVHHGGMGTTAEALRAGIPSVSVPFIFDQPFWARQIHHLGIGPRPISPTHLTAARLAEAIRESVGNPAIRDQAAKIGEQIRAEDGVAAAVEWIENYLQEINRAA